MRTSLTEGTILDLKTESSNRQFVIDEFIGEGANCLVYEAHIIENSEASRKVRIKEFFPSITRVTRDGNRVVWEKDKESVCSKFIDSYKKQVFFQNNSNIGNTSAHVIDNIYEGNDTYYIVVDIDNGWTFDEDYLHTDKIEDIIKTIIALSKAIKSYHDEGFLYLDVKPQNFLVLPETRELVKIIDSDTAVSMEDLHNGNVSEISYSVGWSAPEQCQMKMRLIGEHTDVFAIGAVLFERLMGRGVDNDDIGIFANFNFEHTDFSDLNAKVKNYIIKVLKKCLAASPKKRYQHIDDLLVELEKTLELCQERTFIVDSCPKSDIYFVGRKDELDEMHECLSSEKNVVFLQGFGGIGKSELAKKYAELYADEYDYKVFKMYNDSISSWVKQIDIEGYEHDLGDSSDAAYRNKIKELKKLCSERTLLILDNFDIEPGTDENFKDIIELGAKVIVTTRCDYSQEYENNSTQISLDVMSYEELLDIFEHYCNMELSEDDMSMIKSVFRAIDRYTLLVPIIAKYIAGTGITIKEFCEEFEEKGLLSFDDGSDTVRHAKDGYIYNATMMGHTRRLFNVMSLSDEHKEVFVNLYYLDVFEKLDKQTYKRFTKSRNLNALRYLITIGMIQEVKDRYSDVTYIQIHPIMGELIEADICPEKRSPNSIISYISEEFEKLDKFLNTEDVNQFYKVMAVYLKFMDSDSDYNNKLVLIGKTMGELYDKGVNDIIEFMFQGSGDPNDCELKHIANAEYFIPEICRELSFRMLKSLKTFNEISNIEFESDYMIYDGVLMNALTKYLGISNETIDQMIVHLWIYLFMSKEGRPSDEYAVEGVKMYLKTLDIILDVLDISPFSETNYNYRDKSNTILSKKASNMPKLIYELFCFVQEIFKIKEEYYTKEDRAHLVGIYRKLSFEILYTSGIFVNPYKTKICTTSDLLCIDSECIVEEGLLGKPELQLEAYYPLRTRDVCAWKKSLASSFIDMLVSAEGDSRTKLFCTCLDYMFMLDQPATIRGLLSKKNWLSHYYETHEWSNEDKERIYKTWSQNLYDLTESKKCGRKNIKRNYTKIIQVYLDMYPYILRNHEERDIHSITEINMMFYCASFSLCKWFKTLDVEHLASLLKTDINEYNAYKCDYLLKCIRKLSGIGKRKLAYELKEQLLSLWKKSDDPTKASDTNVIKAMVLLPLAIQMKRDELVTEIKRELLAFTPEKYNEIIWMNDVSKKIMTEAAKYRALKFIILAANLMGDNPEEAHSNLLNQKEFIEPFDEMITNQVSHPSIELSVGSAEIYTVQYVERFIHRKLNILSGEMWSFHNRLAVYNKIKSLKELQGEDFCLLRLIGSIDGAKCIKYILEKTDKDFEKNNPDAYDNLMKYVKYFEDQRNRKFDISIRQMFK